MPSVRRHRWTSAVVVPGVAALLLTLVPAASADEIAGEALASEPGETFATDFGADMVGEPPAGWSTLWRDSDWTVQDGPRRLEHRVAAESRRALTWDAVGTVDGDVEVFALVRGTGRTLFQLPIFASGEAGQENAYYVDVTTLGSARINRYLDGTYSTLGSHSLEPQAGVWYRVVMQRDGQQLRARIWLDGEDEPDSWHLEVTDDALSSGSVGLAGVTGGSTTDWAFVSAGLNGASAPRAPEREPEDLDVDLQAPTEQSPATTRAGHPVMVQMESATPGDYTLEFRPAGTEGWIGFASGTGQGSVAQGTSTITVTMPIDASTGSADLRLSLAAGGQTASVVADGALIVEPAPDLLTGFEARNGQDWTSHEEELDFLAAVADASERVEVEQIGETVEGRPLHLVRVGSPRPPDVDDVADGQSVLALCTQHGGEPSGREACLQWIRELAFTSDDELVNQLADTTVMFVPTANPDGRAANTYGNADGINTNRDHLALETLEAQAMATVLRDTKPDVVIDLHDNGNASETPLRPGEPELESGWARNANVDPAIQDLSEQLVRDWVLAGSDDRGFTTGVWGGTGGNPDERIVRNMAGLRHSVSILTESRNGLSPERPEEATGNVVAGRLRRTVVSRDAIGDLLDFQRAHGEAIAVATGEAAENAVIRGAEQSEPFHLSSSVTLDPPPCGYVLHESLLDEFDVLAALHGIHTEPIDGGAFISMAQQAMTVIPLLLDSQATFTVVPGQRVLDCDDIPVPEPPPGPTDPAQYFADFTDDVVGEPPAGWTPLWRDSDWTVQDDPRRLRHSVSSTGGRRALAWDHPGIVVGDVEVYTKVRAQSDGTMFQVPVHLSGGAQTENAYYADTRLAEQEFRIQAYTNGAASTLARIPFEVAVDRWYHVVVRSEGSRVMAKIWADGDAEPTGWMIDVADNRFSEGMVGFSHFHPGSVNDYAVLGVGVGGEPAPREPVAACPNPDPRPTVVIRDVDSGVPNYLLPDGCTVNDLIRDDDEWPDHGALVDHVATVTDELRNSGVLTPRERSQIVSSAARSGD